MKENIILEKIPLKLRNKNRKSRLNNFNNTHRCSTVSDLIRFNKILLISGIRLNSAIT